MKQRPGSTQLWMEKLQLHDALAHVVHPGEASFEKAFTHPDAASPVVRESFDYGVHHDERRMLALAEAFSHEAVGCLRPAEGLSQAAPAEAPIFVVGMPRSGTRLASGPPCDRRTGARRPLPHLGRSGCAGSRRAGARLVAGGPADAGSILSAFRATTGRQRPSNGGQQDRQRPPPGPRQPDVAGREDHQLPPPRLIEAEYEALVAEPDGNIRRILDFCGLPRNEACPRFFETKRPARSSSLTQVRAPIYTHGAGRWKSRERLLEPLRNVLMDPDAN